MEDRRIKEIRSHLGLSQERFARLLGVSLQTVRRWESGLTKPIPIISLKLEELQKEVRRADRKGGGTAMGEERMGQREAIDIDLGLGGLFKGIGGLFDLIAKMAEEGKEETTRTGEVEALGGKVKGVYGLSVRMGLGGKPVVEQFGNIQETETGPVVTETREPLVDVLDEGDWLIVIAELPGVEEKDIHIEMEGDILEISAATDDRKYQKEVLLPSEIDPGSLESSYRNGILEIKLRRK